MYDAVNNEDMKYHVGTEYILQDVNEMVAKKSKDDSSKGRFY